MSAADPSGAGQAPGVSRRAFLALAGATSVGLVRPLATAAAVPTAVAVAPGLSILPRDAWAEGRPAPGPMPTEAPEDVRFLLVHHSASGNAYAPGDVVAELRAFHAYHTSAEKGWPDVAYNFFVDRFGVVWEGRAGSMTAPVKGDATGGSQGYALLCCLVGDHQVTPPSDAAVGALVRLLGWLAATYGIDTTPGATTSFVSRGSNRWPAGTPVTTTTIAGHRDMSSTACPGDAAYARVRGDLPALVAAFAATITPPTTAPPTTAPPSTTAPATVVPPTTASSPAPVPTSPSTPAGLQPAPRATSAAAAPAPLGSSPRDGVGPVVSVAAGTAVVGAAAAALLAARRRWPADEGQRDPAPAGGVDPEADS